MVEQSRQLMDDVALSRDTAYRTRHAHHTFIARRGAHNNIRAAALRASAA